jgi:hypothetical protein
MMRKMVETAMPTMQLISPEELTLVSGGLILESTTRVELPLVSGSKGILARDLACAQVTDEPISVSNGF